VFRWLLAGTVSHDTEIYPAETATSWLSREADRKD
jgi:hypothetical protein